MKLTVIQLLLFVCITKLEGSSLDLIEVIKNDIYAIYTGIGEIQTVSTNTPVTADGIKYFLFTNNDPENYIEIDPSNPTQLTGEDPIVFFVHGWVANRTVPWYADLKQSFFEIYPQYKVVEVDWSAYANFGYYESSVDTDLVGVFIGEFVTNLYVTYSIPYNNILLIGQSMGAQICGFAGKKFLELTDEKLPRIVGLDPAGPLYQIRSEDNRLNKNNAVVVHVIHTNAGGLGFLGNCGTIDFFPNGGTLQAGCIQVNLTDPSMITSDLAASVFCSHVRSGDYIAEAVGNPQGFNSRRCSSLLLDTTILFCGNIYENMGNLQTVKTGNFYLTTNGESPFSK